MNTQTTPEGLAKNSPFQAPSNLSGDAEWGAAEEPTATPDEITKQVADVNSMQSEVKTLQGQLNDAVKSGDTVKVFDIQDKLDAATGNWMMLTANSPGCAWGRWPIGKVN